MKRALAAACAVAIGLSTALVGTGSAQAAPGQPTKKIVFSDNEDNLFLVNADGSGLHAITSTGNSSTPSFGPDGKRVAYIHSGEVWVTSDGGTPVQVTHVGGSAGDAAWSPNGTWIAFDATVGDYRDIFKVRPTGGAVQRVTFGAARGCYAFTPAWSPDSTRIAYVREGSGAPTCKSLGIVVQKLGGSGFVTVPYPARGPSFTADGKHLVYIAPCDIGDVCGTQQVGWESDASGGHQHMVATEHLCSEGDLCLEQMVGAPDHGWVESLTYAESDDPDATRETCFQGAHDGPAGTVVLTAPQLCLGAVLGGQFDVS